MPIIDIHIHGIGGHGTRGATSRDILKIAEIHGSHGVSAIIPTIYSGSIDQMRLDIAAVKEAMEIQAAEKKSSRLEVQGSRFRKRTSIVDQPEIVNRKSDAETKKNIKPSATAPEGRPRTLNIELCARVDTPATILGVHLEGPFLNPARAGALDRKSFFSAKTSHFRKLVEGFNNVIKIITVAPEINGATSLIRSITDTGVIVSMGHSDATYSETEAGFNAGAKGITHIFNAMRGIHHREPGIAGFGLTNPHVYIEIIADPFHLHPKTIELIFSMKKTEKIIIVSDSIQMAQTDSTIQGITNPSNRLLGGSMTITESARYLISLGFSQDIIKQCIGTNPEQYLTS